MTIESEPIHTIRMSTSDWNELLVTAVNAGYRNRAEYIRTMLTQAKTQPTKLVTQDKEDEDKPEETIKWDGEKGWWAGSKLDQYRPDDAAPIKPTLDSVIDMTLYGNAYFAADTGLPIKASSISFNDGVLEVSGYVDDGVAKSIGKATNDIPLKGIDESFFEK